jgi:hypothetical protein
VAPTRPSRGGTTVTDHGVVSQARFGFRRQPASMRRVFSARGRDAQLLRDGGRLPHSRSTFGLEVRAVAKHV